MSAPESEKIGTRKRKAGAPLFSNNRGGRKLSMEFSHTTVKDGVFTCNYCDSVVSGRPSRIKTHLSKCDKYCKQNEALDLNTDSDSSDVYDNSLAEQKPKQTAVPVVAVA